MGVRGGERYGRKPVLVMGWVSALPLPLILIFAPTWDWIILGNTLLGVNQALTWSMAVNAKIDLSSPEQRGLAVGIDESAGYTGSAIGSWIAGGLAAHFGLVPAPLYFIAAVIVLALLVSVVLVQETIQLAHSAADATDANLSFTAVVKRATYGDRTLFTAAQAGHIENFVDTLVWIALPLFLLSRGVAYLELSLIVGIHHAMYFLQIATGGLADRIGRRPPVTFGMFIAGTGVLALPLVDGIILWSALSAVSGIGMALLYPNLMTVPSDACHPTWRATGMGVYRMWRDAGYAVGAVVIGIMMEYVSIAASFYLTGVLMFLSATLVVLWMEETHPEFGTHEPPIVAQSPPTPRQTDD